MKYIIFIYLISLSLFAQENNQENYEENHFEEVIELEEISESELPEDAKIEEEDYLTPFENNNLTSETNNTLSEPLLNQSSYQLIDPKSDNRRIIFRDRIKVGYDTVRWDYEEFVGGKTFMKDGGQLHGVKATIQNQFTNKKAFWNLLFRYVGGSTLYEGGNQAGDKFNLKSKNSITEFAMNSGYSFDLTSLTFFNPSVGISYRILNNPKNDPRSYTRKAEYLTIPLTLELAQVVTDNFYFSLGTNYHYLLQANTESSLSEVTNAFDDINNEQNEGKGYGAFLNISWLTKNNSINLTPYYRIWDFDDSEPAIRAVSGGFVIFKEPKNKTKELGMNLSVGF